MKNNNIVRVNEDKNLESDNLSILEYLGAGWKEYFYKPETINNIVASVVCQIDITAHARQRLKRVQKANVQYDNITYEFIAISSIIDLGLNRQRMIVLIKNEICKLTEKWSIDISTTFPSWDQISYALYDADECNKKIILYFESLPTSDASDNKIRIENGALIHSLNDIFSYTENVFTMKASILDSLDQEGKSELYFFLFPISLCPDARKKIPSRSIFESSIWDCYYNELIYSAAIQDLFSDLLRKYTNNPFIVEPKWTDKGLFMRIYAGYKLQKTNWLTQDKKEELSKHYAKCKINTKKESGITYLEIQFHDRPVAHFIEYSTLNKFDYAMDIRQQQLDLMMYLHTIF